jgi:hypothetical protein
VEKSDTIETVKQQIIWMLGWIFSQPRDLILVLNHVQLEDARTLRECGITAGTQLTMIMRIRGGGDGMGEADDQDSSTSWTH